MSANESVVAQTVVCIFKQLEAQAQTPDLSSRQQVLKAVKKLGGAPLEDQEQAAFAQILETPIYNFSIRMAVDLGVFHKLARHDQTPMSAGDLAAGCKAEELLLVRIMRVLTAIDYAAELGERKYVTTALSKAMVVPHLEAYTIRASEHAARKALENMERNEQRSSAEGSSRWALATDQSFFDWLQNDPVRAKRFKVYRAGGKTNRI